MTGIGTHTAARRLGVHRCCWVIHCSRKTWLPKKGENFPRHTKLNKCAFIYNKHEAIQKRKFHGARRSSTSSCFEDFPYPYFSTLTQTFFPKVTFQFQKLVWIKSKLLRRHFVDRTSKGKWQTLHNKFDKNIIVIIIIKNTTWKAGGRLCITNFTGTLCLLQSYQLQSPSAQFSPKTNSILNSSSEIINVQLGWNHENFHDYPRPSFSDCLRINSLIAIIFLPVLISRRLPLCLFPIFKNVWFCQRQRNWLKRGKKWSKNSQCGPELELACVREIGKRVGIENIKGNS